MCFVAVSILVPFKTLTAEVSHWKFIYVSCLDAIYWHFQFDGHYLAFPISSFIRHCSIGSIEKFGTLKTEVAVGISFLSQLGDKISGWGGGVNPYFHGGWK